MSANSNTVEGQPPLVAVSPPPTANCPSRNGGLRNTNQMNWLANVLKPLEMGMSALSPSCRQVSRLQSEALNHKLPILQRIGLRIHLFVCRWCRRYGMHIRFLRDAAHDHSDELVAPAPRELADTARERMKQRLRAEEA